jgi:hypothetical protein
MKKLDHKDLVVQRRKRIHEGTRKNTKGKGLLTSRARLANLSVGQEANRGNGEPETLDSPVRRLAFWQQPLLRCSRQLSSG